MTYDTINDAVTIAGGAETPSAEKGTTMDKSIGDGPTMRPKEERGGRGAFSPGDAIAGLPDHMNAALAKALAKEPEERFASCCAIVDALEGKDFSRVEHVERVGSGGGDLGHKEHKERKGGLGKVLAVAALLAALAGGGYYGWTKYDEGVKAAEAKARAEREAPRNGECRTMTLPGGVKMEMIYVAPGLFTMGSSSGEKDETPHQVRITKPYWIGKYPVTQAQWKALVSANGVSFEKGEPTPYFSREGEGSDRVSGMDTSDFPMESVSWNDCDALVKALNRNAADGRTYSLPTEAQWEFAARGGTKTRSYTYSGGNDMDALGWYYENSGLRRLSDSDWKFENLSSNKCRTHSVREKDVGNELGVVGMSGNVCEWCLDWYDKDYYAKSPTDDPCNTASGSSRVLRGGGWICNAQDCRSAYRNSDGPSNTIDNYVGFRLCCSAGPRGGAEQ